MDLIFLEPMPLFIFERNGIHLEQLSIYTLCPIVRQLLIINVKWSRSSQDLPLYLNKEIHLKNKFNFLVNISSHLVLFFIVLPINFKTKHFFPDQGEGNILEWLCFMAHFKWFYKRLSKDILKWLSKIISMTFVRE